MPVGRRQLRRSTDFVHSSKSDVVEVSRADLDLKSRDACCWIWKKEVVPGRHLSRRSVELADHRVVEELAGPWGAGQALWHETCKYVRTRRATSVCRATFTIETEKNEGVNVTATSADIIASY